MNVGAGPILQYIMGYPASFTIAASMAGTAAATQITGSAPCSFASSMSVFNMTGRSLEIIVGADPGAYSATAAGAPSVCGAGAFFVPGTAPVTTAIGPFQRIPVQLSQGQKMFVRTVENTPITAAGTTPLIITLWA